ncbi:MAG TPA: two-component regulator propeller domain-containing protein, partial [Cyclobacteriaceae bacterium]|nr:two-component regulator propeller domain-containing protein [Cyclobacteriaceae bacterium]
MNRLLFLSGLLIILGNSQRTDAQSGIEKIKFSRVTGGYGLSNSNVRCILHDSKGFLWVGTEDGLNRFDGYGFKVYRKTEGDTIGLLKNSINALFEDSHGRMWVATRGGGVHYYDRKLDRFIRIKQFSVNCDMVGMLEDHHQNIWIAGTRLSKAFTARFDYQSNTWKYFDLFDSVEPICSIIQESENEYWIGVVRTGFFKWNSLTNAVERFLPDKKTTNSIVGKDIRKVIKDDQGNIWIAATEGLSKFAVNTGKFTNFTADQGNAMVVNATRDISFDGSYIWVATENGGLSRIDKSSLEFTNFLFDKNDPHSLSDNSVWSVYVDHQGRIWIGTFSKGLCVIDDLREKFSELNVELKNDVVNAIFEDSKGRIWVGTEGGLVMKDKNRVAYFGHEPLGKGSLSSNPVLSIFEDQKRQLWFGTWAGGLNKFDERNKRFINFTTENENPGSLSNPNVYSIKEYSRTHQLLVSSYRGLNVLKDEQRGIFERHIDERHESNNYLRTIYEDSRGNLWLGSIAELYLYSPENRKRTRFNLGNDSVSFDFFINCIAEDKLGNIWVGTNNGLHQLTDKKRIKSFTMKDGLPSNVICGILED